MRKLHIIIILKIITLLLLLFIPAPTEKGFYVFSGIAWVIIFILSIQELNLFHTYFLISLGVFIGMVLILFRKKHLTVLGYLITYAGLIPTLTSKNLKSELFIFVLTLYLVVSGIVIYLIYKRDNGIKA